MDSNPSPAELSSDPDYTFAFNDRNFSDRILKIKVFPDFPVSDSGGEVQKRRKVETNSGTDDDDEATHTVKTIYVSSPILAAKSPYFYELFSNGMMESNQQEVPLEIHVSEEEAFMDLLNFMYSGDLAATSAPDLLKVLIAADKFEVGSCTKYCTRLLRNLPMTCESALLYLHLPPSVSMGEAVRPLSDAAKQFLATHYKDLRKFHEEVLNLPLLGIEAVISSDDLQADKDYRHRCLAVEVSGTNRSFIARAYRHQPIKFIELEFPRLHCFVYLELKRDKCLQLFPSGRIYSEGFYFGGQFFHLLAACCMNQQDNPFGLSLVSVKRDSESVSCAVEYEFSIGSKLCEEYIKKCSGNYTSKEGQRKGAHWNLYGVPWSVLMAESSPYFINDRLHIRAKITLKQ